MCKISLKICVVYCSHMGDGAAQRSAFSFLKPEPAPNKLSHSQVVRIIGIRNCEFGIAYFVDQRFTFKFDYGSMFSHRESSSIKGSIQFRLPELRRAQKPHWSNDQVNPAGRLASFGIRFIGWADRGWIIWVTFPRAYRFSSPFRLTGKEMQCYLTKATERIR